MVRPLQILNPRVLYLVYWGAGEPLGQSLVIPSVTRLADLGAHITLVTFEKPADRANAELMNSIADRLRQHNVEWLPLTYHKHPKALAKGLDFLMAWSRSLRARWGTRFEIVHARTYVGGLMGLPLARAFGAKFVYHNEGFYPDEQVDGGLWRRRSPMHRIARFLEQRLYSEANGIVALSNRAKQDIESMPATRRCNQPVAVVPSCVDFGLFGQGSKRSESNGEVRLVYIGTMGLRYKFDCVARFAAIADQELNGIRFRVLTRTDSNFVASTVRNAGLRDDAWSVDCVPHNRMPNELALQDVGLFFLSQGISEHGCSPTKVGEYWAAGLPVVTTPNVSDTDLIVRKERVGVVVNEHSDVEYRRAAKELRELLSDCELSARCRRAAREHYDLEPACRRQIDLYREILERRTIRK